MSEKSQTLRQPVAFDAGWRASSFSYYLPSVLMTLLLVIVAFLVLTPLFLMILNSFQTARPGQPIVWGLEGWVKAFPAGIVKAMTNTITLAVTRQAIALLVGAYFAWLIARTDIPMKGTLEFLFWLSFFLPALPQTMGWILLLDPKYGLFNQALHAIGISHALFNIYSFWGIIGRISAVASRSKLCCWRRRFATSMPPSKRHPIYPAPAAGIRSFTSSSLS